ncbi:hypothetical protein D6810_03070 [Candidatus Dojkabacteria bacterium]|uniref:Uncharacterized protein n=1 Tax=Candidatus Dojkabacteria bacterium TaxID=2099670 RepID=A0A3M0Z3Q7_9BACT|nr:MAG: hypothetical protein D6810_03070 [Candidatus Dojkabacteria bacterium]
MSFKKIGEVAFILNSKFAVLKTTESLILGSEVLVYNEINLPAEQQTSGLTSAAVPKGKLKVVMMQDEHVYLASVITRKDMSDSYENQSLSRALTLYHSIFGKEDDELLSSDSDLASYSAVLDTTKALNVTISHLVQPGDAITFIQPVRIETSVT